MLLGFNKGDLMILNLPPPSNEQRNGEVIATKRKTNKTPKR